MVGTPFMVAKEMTEYLAMEEMIFFLEEMVMIELWVEREMTPCRARMGAIS